LTSPYPPSSPYGAPAAPQQPYGYPPQAPAQPAGYGYPGQAPAQPVGYGYPAPSAPTYGAPAAPYGQPAYGAPMGAPPGAPTCRVCGGFPAVDATVRAHRGMVILMQFRRQHGPFCRTCGTAAVRDMSAQTLFQGWWSPAGWVFTLITLLRNLGPHNQFKALPPPAPGTHGPQWDPGKPLTSRPAIFMLLWPVAAIVLSIVMLIISVSVHSSVDNTPPYHVSLPGSSSTPGSPSAGSSSGSGSSANQLVLNLLKTGDCVKNTGTSADPNLGKVPCSDSAAEFKILGKLYATTDDAGCDKYQGTTDYFTNEERGNNFVLCMQQLKPGSSSAA